MSEDEKNEGRGSSPLERIIQHGIQALTIMAIGWFAFQVTELKTSSAVMVTKFDAMEQRFGDFKLFMGDRYTSADAAVAHQSMNDKIADHEKRLRQLETGR